MPPEQRFDLGGLICFLVLVAAVVALAFWVQRRRRAEEKKVDRGLKLSKQIEERHRRNRRKKPDPAEERLFQEYKRDEDALKKLLAEADSTMFFAGVVDYDIGFAEGAQCREHAETMVLEGMEKFLQQGEWEWAKGCLAWLLEKRPNSESAKKARELKKKNRALW